MQRSDKALLKIAVERGYLPVDAARQVLRAAKERRTTAERVIRDGKLLSERRMARLNTHYRYRSMRKADKLYGILAIRKDLLTKKQVVKSLKTQKTTFETRRECMRLGSLLIERGLLTVAQDRALRAQASGKALPSEVVRAVSEIPSSAATLAIHEGSKLGIDVAGTTNSYNMITDAVARVDAIREIQATLSTSENLGTDGTPPAGADSANEIESALTMLARQRLGFEAPNPTPVAKKKRRPTKRSTGLMAIFRLTA